MSTTLDERIAEARTLLSALLKQTESTVRGLNQLGFSVSSMDVSLLDVSRLGKIAPGTVITGVSVQLAEPGSGISFELVIGS